MKKSTKTATKPSTKPAVEEEEVEVESEEVSIELDSKGVPVWKDDKGNFIPGLQKKHFLNDDAMKVDKNHAKKQFFLYMQAFKENRAIFFANKVEDLKAEAEDYAKLAAEVGIQLTPKQLAARKLASLQKQLEAQQKLLEELE